MTEHGEFTCDACGETFPKAWSDEEAHAEAEEVFPDGVGDDPAMVCDDCYEQMTAAFATLRARRILSGLPGGPPHV